MIHSLDSYYFDEEFKTFKLKPDSKLSKNIRNILASIFVVTSIFVTAETSHFAFVPYTPITTEQTNNFKVTLYQKYIESQNQKLTDEESSQIVDSVLKWSYKFSLDERMIFSIISAESGFDKHAVSTAGAFGLMQVITKYHIDKIIASKSVNASPEPFAIDTNIFLGTWIYKDCSKKYSTLSQALKCYNGSVGLSTNYDKKVIAKLKELKEFTGA